MLGLDKGAQHAGMQELFSTTMSNAHFGGLTAVVQNVRFCSHSLKLASRVRQIPLVLLLQSPSASLGSFALYRTSVQSLVFTIRALVQTVHLAVQGVFLMGAFSAAMEVQPRLSPKKEQLVRYKSTGRGVKIEARQALRHLIGGAGS